MLLSPVPAQAAPDFKLVDQHGRSFSMSDFKGRAVILEFMDPHCVDICPLVSKEFVNAYHDLGKAASHVVFIAVNVNQYFSSVASVATFSSEHQLDTIPSWRFLTGSTIDLKAVWRNYGVTVVVPNPKADIVHTSVIYFIDARGRERYVATPEADHTSSGTSFLPTASLTAWGRGIALVAKSLVR
jgi:cytochrome oxidase Cu insertion factor (SCO1/SenC/PrrC family)